MGKNNPKIVVVGSINMDIMVKTNKNPDIGETILGESIRYSPGGKGANQAIYCSKLGAEVSFIGSVGDDKFGKTMIDNLENKNVDVSGVKKIKGIASGTAIVNTVDNNNSIIVIKGANEFVGTVDIDNNLNLIEQADVVLLQLEIPTDTVLYVAKLAHELNKTVILNPAPALSLPKEIYKYIDYLTPNETELEYYLKEIDIPISIYRKDLQTLKMPIELLQNRGPTVITTLGEIGSAYVENDMLEIVKSFKTPVVDTTGAGDSFNAGLAYSIALEKNLKESLVFASAVSGVAIQEYGAQSMRVNINNVLNLIKSYKS